MLVGTVFCLVRFELFVGFIRLFVFVDLGPVGLLLICWVCNFLLVLALIVGCFLDCDVCA